MDNGMLTPADVAKILSVGANTARDIIRRLPHITIGGRYRIRREVIEKYIIDREVHYR